MKIEIDIQDKYIRQAIESGLNGGIQYWCARYEVSNGFTYSGLLANGVGSVFIVEKDESGPKEGRHFLDYENVQRALEWLADSDNDYSITFMAICQGQADSWHGDTLIQVAIFGWVKYA